MHRGNTFLALILPVVTSPFLIIIFSNTIRQLPRDLFDAVEIDGAGDFTVIFRVVMPLMLPMVAAFIVYNAVNYWNDWTSCLSYIRDAGKYTPSYKLRELINNVSQEYDARNLVKTVVIERLVAERKIRPHIRMDDGESGFVARLHNYGGRLVLHLLNTRLEGIPHDKTRDEWATPNPMLNGLLPARRPQPPRGGATGA